MVITKESRKQRNKRIHDLPFIVKTAVSPTDQSITQILDTDPSAIDAAINKAIGIPLYKLLTGSHEITPGTYLPSILSGLVLGAALGSAYGLFTKDPEWKKKIVPASILGAILLPAYQWVRESVTPPYEKMTEKQLKNLVRQGDREAAETLASKYAPVGPFGFIVRPLESVATAGQRLSMGIRSFSDEKARSEFFSDLGNVLPATLVSSALTAAGAAGLQGVSAITPAHRSFDLTIRSHLTEILEDLQDIMRQHDIIHTSGREIPAHQLLRNLAELNTRASHLKSTLEVLRSNLGQEAFNNLRIEIGVHQPNAINTYTISLQELYNQLVGDRSSTRGSYLDAIRNQMRIAYRNGNEPVNARNIINTIEGHWPDALRNLRNQLIQPSSSGTGISRLDLSPLGSAIQNFRQGIAGTNVIEAAGRMIRLEQEFANITNRFFQSAADVAINLSSTPSGINLNTIEDFLRAVSRARSWQDIEQEITNRVGPINNLATSNPRLHTAITNLQQAYNEAIQQAQATIQRNRPGLEVLLSSPISRRPGEYYIRVTLEPHDRVLLYEPQAVSPANLGNQAVIPSPAKPVSAHGHFILQQADIQNELRNIASRSRFTGPLDTITNPEVIQDELYRRVHDRLEGDRRYTASTSSQNIELGAQRARIRESIIETIRRTESGERLRLPLRVRASNWLSRILGHRSLLGEHALARSRLGFIGIPALIAGLLTYLTTPTPETVYARLR